ncbi:PAS domain S-box-containing protein [Bradyrhizobium sp. USDA 4513]
MPALPRQRAFLAIAACLAGITASWLTKSPFGLLAVVAALYLHVDRRAALLLRVVWAVAFVGAIAAHFHAHDPQSAALSLALFAILALCIGEIVAIPSSVKLSADAVQAMRIIESMPAYTWSASPDGHITHVSASTLAYLGELADKTGLFHVLDNAGWRRAIHPDDYAQVMEIRRHSLKTGIPFDAEYRVRGSDGTYRWFRSFGSLSRDERGELAGWYGTMIDIEAKRQAEDALRKSERQLQQLIDAVPALIWSTTPDGTPTYVNKRFKVATGASLEDITAPDGSPSLSVVHPDDRAAAIAAITHSFRTGEPYVMIYRQLRAGGAYHWTETRAEPLRDDAGNIIQWYGVSVDIHDLVTAQEAVKESERSLRQLVETLPAMIDCAAPDGEPIYRSRQLREFLGYDLEELDGNEKGRLEATLDAGVHPDDLDGVKQRYAHSLASGEPYARRHRLRRFDGEYRWVETRAGAMRNADGAIVQWNVICLDIDAEVRAQEELRMAQAELAGASQAASLAELSASIAHEVNQPLAAVVANSHACQRWLTADPPNLERGAQDGRAHHPRREWRRRCREPHPRLVQAIARQAKQRGVGQHHRRGARADVRRSRAAPHPARYRCRIRHTARDRRSRSDPAGSEQPDPQRHGGHGAGHRRQIDPDPPRSDRGCGSGADQRPWPGRRIPRPGVSAVFHDEGVRDGHGPCDLPLDRRVAWWAFVGGRK